MKQLTAKACLFLFGLLLTVQLPGQFGVSGFRTQSFDKFVSLETNEDQLFGNGYELAVDYWFRLPSKRIEFYPTVSYGTYDATEQYTIDRQVFTNNIAVRTIGVQLKTNFYVFDFGTDCDCPTWGKQGPAFHKGFYFSLQPGVSQIKTEVNSPDFAEENIHFNLGVGAGIDFGISNLITLSPSVTYRHYFTDLDFRHGTPDLQLGVPERVDQFAELLFGLRLGIRLDERRY